MTPDQIERIKRAIDEMAGEMKRVGRICDEARAEVARLRAVIVDAIATIEDSHNATAARDKLRAALQARAPDDGFQMPDHLAASPLERPPARKRRSWFWWL